MEFCANIPEVQRLVALQTMLEMIRDRQQTLTFLNVGVMRLKLKDLVEIENVEQANALDPSDLMTMMCDESAGQEGEEAAVEAADDVLDDNSSSDDEEAVVLPAAVGGVPDEDDDELVVVVVADDSDGGGGDGLLDDNDAEGSSDLDSLSEEDEEEEESEVESESESESDSEESMASDSDVETEDQVVANRSEADWDGFPPRAFDAASVVGTVYEHLLLRSVDAQGVVTVLFVILNTGTLGVSKMREIMRYVRLGVGDDEDDGGDNGGCCIIVTNNPVSTHARDSALMRPNTQLFLMSDVFFNRTKHILVPKHELVSTEDEAAFYERYQLKPDQIAWLLTTDPICRYYNYGIGSLIRITRASTTAGRYVMYRVVHEPLFCKK